MVTRRISGLIVVGVMLSVLSAGCGDRERSVGDVREPGGDVPDCRRDIRGVTGVIRPETSKLTCTEIDSLTFGLPAEPESYLIEGDSPGMHWKCRFRLPEEQAVLLRCVYRQKHFSIVDEASLSEPNGAGV